MCSPRGGAPTENHPQVRALPAISTGTRSEFGILKGELVRGSRDYRTWP